MNASVSGTDDLQTSPSQTREKPRRLHYLDWLQVLAILGVFPSQATTT